MVQKLPPDFERLAELFKLLSDSSRLNILWCICQGECNVGQICAMTDLTQANVSKHLQVLRMGGVVSCRKEGTMRIYSLADSRFLNLCAQSVFELSPPSQAKEMPCEKCELFTSSYQSA